MKKTKRVFLNVFDKAVLGVTVVIGLLVMLTMFGGTRTSDIRDELSQKQAELKRLVDSPPTVDSLSSEDYLRRLQGNFKAPEDMLRDARYYEEIYTSAGVVVKRYPTEDMIQEETRNLTFEAPFPKDKWFVKMPAAVKGQWRRFIKIDQDPKDLASLRVTPLVPIQGIEIYAELFGGLQVHIRPINIHKAMAQLFPPRNIASTTYLGRIHLEWVTYPETTAKTLEYEVLRKRADETQWKSVFKGPVSQFQNLGQGDGYSWGEWTPVESAAKDPFARIEGSRSIAGRKNAEQPRFGYDDRQFEMETIYHYRVRALADVEYTDLSEKVPQTRTRREWVETIPVVAQTTRRFEIKGLISSTPFDTDAPKVNVLVKLAQFDRQQNSWTERTVEAQVDKQQAMKKTETDPQGNTRITQLDFDTTVPWSEAGQKSIDTRWRIQSVGREKPVVWVEETVWNPDGTRERKKVPKPGIVDQYYVIVYHLGAPTRKIKIVAGTNQGSVPPEYYQGDQPANRLRELQEKIGGGQESKGN